MLGWRIAQGTPINDYSAASGEAPPLTSTPSPCRFRSRYAARMPSGVFCAVRPGGSSSLAPRSRRKNTAHVPREQTARGGTHGSTRVRQHAHTRAASLDVQLVGHDSESSARLDGPGRRDLLPVAEVVDGDQPPCGARRHNYRYGVVVLWDAGFHTVPLLCVFHRCRCGVLAQLIGAAVALPVCGVSNDRAIGGTATTRAPFALWV